MVCTKCGAELKDSDLFCLSCGQEVQIVPDYNPMEEIVIQNLVEAQQAKTHEDTKDTIERQDMATKELPSMQDMNTKKLPVLPAAGAKEPKGRKKQTVNIRQRCIIGGAAAVILIGGIAFGISRRNSYEYQYQKAKRYLEKEHYEKAYEYLERCLALNNSDVNVRFLMKDIALEMEDIDGAVKVLKDILAIDPENTEAGRELIGLYTRYDRAEELAAFLSGAEGTKLASALKEYYLEKPVFSVEEGTYDRYISVEIAAGEGCDIYYTVDGSKATKDAIQYSGQIRLRGGTTQIRAIAVNEEGLISMETVKQYVVHSTVPDNPVISPASGQYGAPVPIVIEVPENCRVYYTLDGTEPTENSRLYMRPLDMPIGQHVLSVVAIDANGIVSNTIQSRYNLAFETVFSAELAYDIILQKLGHELADGSGAFQLECTAATEIGGFNLYCFDKVYGTDSKGNKIYGADKYMFDVLTGETFHAVVNAAGGYDLTPF